MEKMPGLNTKLEAGVMREPQFGPIFLELDSQALHSSENNKAEKLSDQEYQILWLLVRAKGGVITKSEIEDFLYADIPDNKDAPMGNGVDVQLHRVKAKLHSVSAGKVLIQNVRNIGWKLELLYPEASERSGPIQEDK